MALRIFRVVFDCNIFIQSLLNPKSVAAKCFDSVRNKHVSLFVSKATLDEVRDVLMRPNILSRLPDANAEQIESFIENIVNISIFLKSVSNSFHFQRDPKDEIIINLAVEAEADYIVSRDKDLLDLMTGFDSDSKEFRQRFRPLRVVGPIEFLKIIQEKDLSLES